MPLSFKLITANGWIAVWHICETADQLRSMLTPADISDCEGITNPRRQLQRLAWRAALREMLPGAGVVSYGESGAPLVDDSGPQVDNSGLYIGVSHCADHAAIICCERPCAIDIEPFARNFDKAAARYVDCAEASLAAAADPRFNAVVWCAKEALYKLSGLRELDLLDDICITGLDFHAHGTATIQGTVRGIAAPALQMLTVDDICIVHT